VIALIQAFGMRTHSCANTRRRRRRKGDRGCLVDILWFPDFPSFGSSIAFGVGHCHFIEVFLSGLHFVGKVSKSIFSHIPQRFLGRGGHFLGSSRTPQSPLLSGAPNRLSGAPMPSPLHRGRFGCAGQSETPGGEWQA
jgi:hypothetical protein